MENNLEQLKKVELDIFRVFIDVCKRLNLKYYIAGGTLLGAVRHSGFIPWDDDIDIGMPREDYEKFIEYGQNYLPDYYFLQSYKSDKQWLRHFCKIRDSRTTFVESTVKHLNINHGVWIDIFPLDFINKKKQSFYNKILALNESNIFGCKTISRKIKVFMSKIITFKFSDKSAFEKREKLLRKVKNGKYLAFFSGAYGEKEIFPKEWFDEGTLLDFEGVNVNAPKEYKKYLSQVYGDYMCYPPKEKRVPHHYCDIIDLNKSYNDYIKGE